MKSYSTVYSLLQYICTTHDIESDKECKIINKKSKLTNQWLK